MQTENTKFGLSAESAVCEYLLQSGFSILDRNWRRPWGEIDIVAKQGDTLHFIEVKASRARSPGFEPYLRANNWKMHKIMRTAQTWLSFNRYDTDTEWQMDIASVIMDGDTKPEIELFQQI